MDDELGLLRDQQDPGPPRRPVGLLLAAVVLVALLAAGGVLWLVTSVAGRGGTVTGAASPAPATAAPTTTAAEVTAPPTVRPSPASPATTPAPEPSATVLASPPPRPTPAPTRPPAPAPTSRPVPRPTLSSPVGRLVTVPDVTGLLVQQADTVLRAAGFRVQVIGGVLDPDRDDRRIVAQRPTAGSTALAGSTVILTTNGT